MTRRIALYAACLFTLAIASASLRGDEPKANAKPPAGDAKPAAGEAKAIELFNGKDLTGWGYKNGETFDGKTESSDKRYTAKDGMIVVNPGKGLAQLWTTAKFPKDFELRLEFRAAVNADS